MFKIKNYKEMKNCVIYYLITLILISILFSKSQAVYFVLFIITFLAFVGIWKEYDNKIKSLINFLSVPLSLLISSLLFNLLPQGLPISLLFSYASLYNFNFYIKNILKR